MGNSNFACWFGTISHDLIEVHGTKQAVVIINGSKAGLYNPEITNVFYTYDGEDIIITGVGDDIVEAGNGKDVIRARDGKNIIYGNEREPSKVKDHAMDKFFGDGELILPDYQAGERINELIDVEARDKN